MKIEKSLYVMCKDYMKTVERSKTWWSRILFRSIVKDISCAGLCSIYSQYGRDSLTPVFEHYLDTDRLAYPFGGYDVYQKEQCSGTMHKNPERLAFVKRIIEDYEKQEDMV